MVKYAIYFSKQAQKVKKLLVKIGLQKKVEEILEIMTNNPHDPTYHYEKLKYELEGLYSRRINYQHRLVYEVDDQTCEITIHRMWSHYDGL